MVDTLLEPGGHVRPTRRRLSVAMAVSACCVAAVLAMLGSLIDFVRALSGPAKIDTERLTVVVRDGEPEPERSLTAAEHLVPPPAEQEKAASDDTSRQQDSVNDDTPVPPANAEPVIDWHAMADAAVESSVAVYFDEKEFRTAMWRKNHAIMFKSAGEIEIREEAAVIPGFRFKREIHVVGLGFTIGACFFGVPLAGVPVEQRSTAITFFVCAADAG